VSSRAALEALVRRNADRCESAKSKRCECHCGGAFHGKAHSAEWVRQTVDAIHTAHKVRDGQADWPTLFDDLPSAPAQPGEDS
jgi:hypothetical protein